MSKRTRSSGPLRARRGAVAGAAALLAVAPLAAPPALARASLTSSMVGSSVVGGSVVGSSVVGGPELAGHGVIVRYPAHGARRLPSVHASSYVIADAGTGQVLAAKDPHGHFKPASTLKILTADTLMPVLNPDQSVVTSHMAAVVTPSKVGLEQRHSYQVKDLFKALLLISANDAAISLAQATGSYARGVAMMNAEAHRLQADDTVARRPNGLNAKGQHTSAYDLALFARQALTMPTFLKIEAIRVTKFPLYRKSSVKLWNQNTMLGTYPGDLGGKIGWTTQSEATFIAWARRGGRTLVVTIMHCVPLTEMTVAARLLNWGFAMDGKVTPVGSLAPPLPAGVAGAAAAYPTASGSQSASPGPQGAAVQHPGHQVAGARKSGDQRAARLTQAAGVPTIPLTAGIGALVLAALVAGVIAVLLRCRPGGGSPPGP